MPAAAGAAVVAGLLPDSSFPFVRSCAVLPLLRAASRVHAADQTRANDGGRDNSARGTMTCHAETRSLPGPYLRVRVVRVCPAARCVCTGVAVAQLAVVAAAGAPVPHHQLSAARGPFGQRLTTSLDG